jgi:diamine N-acetyltransferase
MYEKMMRQVTLRALEPEDVDIIYHWENDPAVWKYSAAHTPFSRHALTQYILAAMDGDIFSQRQLRLMGDSNGRTVGCIDLFDFDPYHHHAGVGLLVDSALRQQGYGAALLSALLPYCAKELQIHLLYCDIATANTPCIRLFQQQGFSLVGTRHEWLFAGDHYEDAVCMEKIL